MRPEEITVGRYAGGKQGYIRVVEATRFRQDEDGQGVYWHWNGLILRSYYTSLKSFAAWASHKIEEKTDG